MTGTGGKKKISAPRRAVTAVKRVLLILIAVALVIGVILAVYSSVCRAKGATAFVFGYSTMWVQTGSMEPTIGARSAILVRRADPENPPTVGDIISYICRDPKSEVYGALITHRIVAAEPDGYRTKGDSPLATEDALTVPLSDIQAVYIKNLPVVSFFSRLFSTWLGLAAVGVLFLISVGGFVIPDAVRALSEEDNEKKEAERHAEIARRIEEEVSRLGK